MSFDFEILRVNYFVNMALKGIKFHGMALAMHLYFLIIEMSNTHSS